MFQPHREKLIKAKGKKDDSKIFTVEEAAQQLFGHSCLNNIKPVSRIKANKHCCCKKVVLHETEISFPI